MAAYAASLPLVHRPGTVWNYSSGTTNIVSRIVTDAICGAVSDGGGSDGGAEVMEAFLRDRLFHPTGMSSAIPKFDTAGTFVGSSYVYATARDFARFGQLALDDGMVGDERILPEGWIDVARTQIAFDETDDGGFGYGRHWWLWPEFPGSMACHGYEGQYTLVVPARDLVVVHLGKVPVLSRPVVRSAIASIVAAFDD
jgi:CubicO group peptidase (beta-lactamase class C family)